MSGRVIRHDAAQSDLEKHVRYLTAEASPQTARRFLQAADEAMSRLASMPGMGSPCEFRNPEAAGLKFWTIKGFVNYVIIYRPVNDGIEIVRLVHAASNWQAIFEE